MSKKLEALLAAKDAEIELLRGYVAKLDEELYDLRAELLRGERKPRKYLDDAIMELVEAAGTWPRRGKPAPWLLVWKIRQTAKLATGDQGDAEQRLTVLLTPPSRGDRKKTETLKVKVRAILAGERQDTRGGTRKKPKA